MKDEYWKKRYEKLLEAVVRECLLMNSDEWREIVEEEIEAEEIGMEGTVEDAKVRKVTRHDTP